MVIKRRNYDLSATYRGKRLLTGRRYTRNGAEEYLVAMKELQRRGKFSRYKNFRVVKVK